MAVKCEDSDESYGEGCISLLNLFADKPQRFKCEISHRGAHIGILSGAVHIVGHVGEGRMKRLLTDDDDAGLCVWGGRWWARAVPVPCVT